MFALDCHWGGNYEWYGFCPSSLPLSTAISTVFAGKFVVNSWWNYGKCLVAIHPRNDVHYLGLELS
jgi:hypothetical protein